MMLLLLLLLLMMMMMMMVVMLIQVKAVSRRVECQARIIMTVGVVVGLIMVIVWETVYTPAAHVHDDSNSTVSSSNAAILRRWTYMDYIIL